MINNIKKCYLDTNILIGFKHEDSIFYKRSKKLLKNLISESFTLYISPLVLDEFLFQIKLILQRQQIYKLINEYLREILNIPKLKIINPPLSKQKQHQVLNYMEKYSLRPRDAYHLLIIKENKISHFATFDKDFKKVFKAKVIKKFV